MGYHRHDPPAASLDGGLTSNHPIERNSKRGGRAAAIRLQFRCRVKAQSSRIQPGTPTARWQQRGSKPCRCKRSAQVRAKGSPVGGPCRRRRPEPVSSRPANWASRPSSERRRRSRSGTSRRVPDSSGNWDSTRACEARRSPSTKSTRPAASSAARSNCSPRTASIPPTAVTNRRREALRAGQGLVPARRDQQGVGSRDRREVANREQYDLHQHRLQFRCVARRQLQPLHVPRGGLQHDVHEDDRDLAEGKG